MPKAERRISKRLARLRKKLRRAFRWYRAGTARKLLNEAELVVDRPTGPDSQEELHAEATSWLKLDQVIGAYLKAFSFFFWVLFAPLVLVVGTFVKKWLEHNDVPSTLVLTLAAMLAIATAWLKWEDASLKTEQKRLRAVQSKLRKLADSSTEPAEHVPAGQRRRIVVEPTSELETLGDPEEPEKDRKGK